MNRKCDNCKSEYSAKNADVMRGWGLCCSKSCAANKREKLKPGYNKKTVYSNNIRRANWNKDRDKDDWEDWPCTFEESLLF